MSELAVLRYEARLLLARQGLLAVLVRALVKFLFIVVAPDTVWPSQDSRRGCVHDDGSFRAVAIVIFPSDPSINFTSFPSQRATLARLLKVG
jgi:hypothetical protein